MAMCKLKYKYLCICIYLCFFALYVFTIIYNIRLQSINSPTLYISLMQTHYLQINYHKITPTNEMLLIYTHTHAHTHAHAHTCLPSSLPNSFVMRLDFVSYIICTVVCTYVYVYIFTLEQF